MGQDGRWQGSKERLEEKEHKERKITCTLRSQRSCHKKKKGEKKAPDSITCFNLCLENSDSVKI